MNYQVFIKTFGCALNQSDSELMAGLLQKAEFDITDDIEKADVIIVNTCTVKGPTETNFFKYLGEIKKLGKPIIIAGCIAQTDPEKVKGYNLIGTYEVNRIAEVVEEAVNDNVIELLAEEKYPRLNLPKVRKNPVIEIIPICAGCLGEPCAYCKVKAARGSLVSYDKKEILRQAQHAMMEGVKEIWLTAQDTGCYGKDNNSNLPELLKELTHIGGDFKIRLGMLNPNHILGFLDELIDAYKSDKMFKFLHVPVQSGSDNILKLMKRKYTVDDFKKIVSRFREAIPEITIATDVICGFPDEKEEDYDKTRDLIKEIKPDVLNISKFWARPKTAAASMGHKVKGEEIKRRSSLMTDLFNNISRMRNEKWLGWNGEILVDEIGKDDTFVGRNYAYKPVIVKGNLKIGDNVKVHIRRATSFDLRGDIC